MSRHQFTICIDFDGVLHSYESGWEGHDKVSDPPVEGAIEWLERMVASVRFKPVIYSSRSIHSGGILAMKQWLLGHGLPSDALAEIEFPKEKPAAYLTIDDRALCFVGEFPSMEWMLAFKPWNHSRRRD